MVVTCAACGERDCWDSAWSCFRCGKDLPAAKSSSSKNRRRSKSRGKGGGKSGKKGQDKDKESANSALQLAKQACLQAGVDCPGSSDEDGDDLSMSTPTVEDGKEEDPAELNERLAELRKAMAALPRWTSENIKKGYEQQVEELKSKIVETKPLAERLKSVVAMIEVHETKQMDSAKAARHLDALAEHHGRKADELRLVAQRLQHEHELAAAPIAGAIQQLAPSTLQLAEARQEVESAKQTAQQQQLQMQQMMQTMVAMKESFQQVMTKATEVTSQEELNQVMNVGAKMVEQGAPTHSQLLQTMFNGNATQSGVHFHGAGSASACQPGAGMRQEALPPPQ